jgi:hypothetical protein
MLFLVVLSLLALASYRSLAGTSGFPALLGTWVQDQTGPVVTHERIYRFSRDGSYEFLFTARNTGSTNRRTLLRERGKFAIRGNRLVISPNSGTPRAFPWRVEKDPYVGDVRLVLVLSDGTLDIYYRR